SEKEYVEMLDRLYSKLP
nr:Chain d, eukaryotic initiation factor 2 subunit Beta (eIF2-Beta) [Oryctolagus cuniculus]6FEC_d Chain d, EUKARYOTIC TRANSLATION INITIATION FACTOR 2 BETA SUBUNIT (eIF2-Beta) [Homo sapiens]